MFARRGSVRGGESLGTLVLILYVVFGIYFINFFPLMYNFLNLPASLIMADNWIIFVAGVLLIVGAINAFRIKRLKRILLLQNY